MASCATSSLVRWIILHDTPAPSIHSENVQFVALSLNEFRRKVLNVLGVTPPEQLGYKICDFKPAYGALFGEFLQDFEYFGWGDLDVIYGDLDRFLHPLLGRWEVLSFHRCMLSNHFCILRNTEDHRNLLNWLPGGKDKLAKPGYQQVDDGDLSRLLAPHPTSRFVEHFSTPFVNWMPWVDGTYNFPRRWFWNRGQLTNSLDRGYEFLYLHFMVWKGGRKSYYCDVPDWQGMPGSRLGDQIAKGEAFAIDGSGIRSLQSASRGNFVQMTDEQAPRRTLLRRIRTRLQ
jgi:hypothetical protein